VSGGGNWRESLPSKNRVFTLLAFSVMFAAVFGDVMLIAFSILPQWRLWEDLASEVAALERQVQAAGDSQSSAADLLRDQIAGAQAELNEAAEVFLSDAQATAALDNLYEYAAQSHVEIVGVAGQAVAESSPVYDVRSYRVVLEGELSDLVEFVSRIDEAKYSSFVITNLIIVESVSGDGLTMDITLYTSPYSSGAAAQVDVSPSTDYQADYLEELNQKLAVAWATENWEEAAQTGMQLLAIDSSNSEAVAQTYYALVNYGAELLRQGNTAGAVDQFKLALDLRPDGIEAASAIELALATPVPTLSVQQQLARDLDIAWAVHDWEQCVSLTEQILALDPGNAQYTDKLYSAHVNYGYALIAAGNLTGAKNQFTLALEIKPDGGEAALGLQSLASDL